MAVGRPTAGRPRGGAGISSLRPARARLITAALALGALGAATVFVLAEGGRFALLSEGAAGAGLAVLAGGLALRWSGSIPAAVLLVGGGYLAGRAGHAAVDGWAALIGVLLLLAGELASWSIDHDARIRSEPALVVRRALTLAALVVAALVVNVVLLATAAVSAAPGALLATVGVAAAVAAVAVVLRLARVE